MSLDLFDRLSLFIDLLGKNRKVFVVERSSAPPTPLDPAVARLLDDEMRAFFGRTSALRFWWFLESERRYENPEDYRPGAMGGFIHLVAPTLPDLVVDRLPRGSARFEAPIGMVYVPEDGPSAYLGSFGAYVQRACRSAFTADWHEEPSADHIGLDSRVRDIRAQLLGPADRHLVDPVDVEGIAPHEKPATDPEARVKALVARGATESEARSLVEWLRDDIALLLG